MINCWNVSLFLCLSTSSFAEAVDTCVVHVQPPSTVVVAGERVSLNCTVTRGDFSISSWQIGTDLTNKTAVYTAPRYGRNGNVTKNKYVADGYSVTNTTDHKTIALLMNQINLSQSGLYVCQCDDTKSFTTTFVVVLASEPKISVISSVATGKSVSLCCNISFSGSADISSNLSIKDISGTTVNMTVCYPRNRPTSCSVGYTTIANSSVHQSYNCSVQLIANSITIYSKTLNTYLEWKQVIRAEIVLSNPNKCSAGKCIVGDSITCKPEIEGTLGIIFYKWWQIQQNESKLEIRDGNQTLVLTKSGHFTYQCEAYVIIRGVRRNATSQLFIIEITANDNSVSGLTSTTMIVVIGISVAIGIVIVVIAIFVTRICGSRKQTNRHFQAISTDESSAPPPHRQPTNRYDKTKVRDPGQQQVSASTSSNHPASSNNDIKLVEHETVLFDNVLYGEARCASPDPVAPSVPEENIYNEIPITN